MAANPVEAAIKAGLISTPLEFNHRIVLGLFSVADEDVLTLPSLLVKAYAIALRDQFGPDTNLSQSKRAIFVASPQQKGVPAVVAREYSNEQLYQLANSLPLDNSLGFQSGDTGYFQYLDDYLAHSCTPDDPSPAAWRPYMIQRGKVALEASKLYQLYQDMLQDSDVPPKWQDLVNSDKAKAYRDACDARDQAAQDLHLNNPGLLQALQMMDSAKATAVPRSGQNMPCTLLDTPGSASSRLKAVDAKNIFYRPTHLIGGFFEDADSWVNNFQNQMNNPDSFHLDLRGANSQSWASLGFPQFDKLKSPLTTADIDALAGWDVTVSFTAMQAYSVDRGSWDIAAFRSLYPLVDSAEDYLVQTVNKVVSLLLGYGVQIRLKRPADLTISAASMPGILGGMSFKKVSATEWQTSTPSNDAYPVLLALLARKS